MSTHLKYSIQVFNSDFDSVYCLESMLQPGVLLLSLLQIVLMAQIDLSKSKTHLHRSADNQTSTVDALQTSTLCGLL